MIYHVSGDILLSKAQVVAHGVAANDPMSQGLALALHKKYPSMHKDYHHWCHVKHPKPGEAWMWGGSDGVRIVNLITQEGGYGHGARSGDASLKNVRNCLKSLEKISRKESFTSIALPRIATGVGGLSWSDVEPLISQKFGDVKIPVYLYSDYVPGKSAEEAIT